MVLSNQLFEGGLYVGTSEGLKQRRTKTNISTMRRRLTVKKEERRATSSLTSLVVSGKSRSERDWR